MQWLRKLWNRQKIYLNNRYYNIKKLTLEETIKIVFLLLPYFKELGQLKTIYEDDSDVNTFYFLTKNILDSMDLEDANKFFSLLFGIDIEVVKIIPFSEFMKYLPRIIRENKLLELYMLLNNIGMLK